MKTASEITSGLSNFYGTQGYHRLTLSPKLLATDGVRWLAENAECFWLLDEIANAQSLPVIQRNQRLQEMQFWTLEVTGSKAVLTCEEDSDMPVWSKNIDYTDFPLNTIKLYVAPLDETRFVVMCPSEY
jgi:hypothetical protein